MGTRGNILFYNRTNKLGGLYIQYDAYPTGVGRELKQLLNDGNVTIVNGYQPGQQAPAYFNGMGCFGAYLIGKLKGEEIGGYYLDPTDPTEAGSFNDWTYRFILKGNDPITGRMTSFGTTAELCLEVYHWERKLWDGPFSAFEPDAVEKLAYGEDD